MEKVEEMSYLKLQNARLSTIEVTPAAKKKLVKFPYADQWCRCPTCDNAHKWGKWGIFCRAECFYNPRKIASKKRPNGIAYIVGQAWFNMFSGTSFGSFFINGSNR